MYSVYIIRNSKGEHYTGYTADVSKRLIKHNQGSTISTRKYKDWTIVYLEKFKTKRKAIIREKYIKNKKSRKFINSLIHRGVEK